MAKKSRKKTKKASNPSLSSKMNQWLATEQGQALKRRAIHGLLALLILGGVVLGMARLERYVVKVSGQNNQSLTVEMANRPAWATRELMETVCLASGVRSDDPLLDKDLAETWANNLALCPWVKQVRKIRKHHDGRVVFDCELREPLAKVNTAEHSYYLDAEGIALPAVRLADAHVVKLVGPMNGELQPGHPIDSKAYIAGIEVLSIIRQVDQQLPSDQRIYNELAILDVGNYNARLSEYDPHLRFYTEGNTEIRWGAAVGREHAFFEAPTKTKLTNLYRAHRQYGSLDVYQYVELRDFRKEKTDPMRQG